jgi:hypothetical protein
VPIEPYAIHWPNALCNQSSSQLELEFATVSLATVRLQLIPPGCSVFALFNRAYEYHASMEVIKMSLKILGSTHGLLSASFAVTFISVLLGLIVVAYCADFFRR